MSHLDLYLARQAFGTRTFQKRSEITRVRAPSIAHFFSSIYSFLFYLKNQQLFLRVFQAREAYRNGAGNNTFATTINLNHSQRDNSVCCASTILFSPIRTQTFDMANSSGLLSRHADLSGQRRAAFGFPQVPPTF